VSANFLAIYGAQSRQLWTVAAWIRRNFDTANEILEIVADKLSAAGWSWVIAAPPLTLDGWRWIVDAHREGRR
jgi:hypothetical protein